MNLRATLASVAVAAAAGLAMPAWAGYQLSLTAVPGSGPVGMQAVVDVNLELDGGSTLVGAQFKLSFDPDVLSFRTGVLGALTGQGLFSGTFEESVPGTIAAIMAVSIDGEPLLADTAGSIAQVTFDLKRPGFSELTLSDPIFLDFELAELQANAAPGNARITVTPRNDAPEPAASLLAGLGLGLLVWTQRRRAR